MTGAALEPRPRAWPALAAYAAAFVGSLAAAALLVGGVARARSGPSEARFAEEIARFTSSVLGLSAVALVDAAVLAGVALAAARWPRGSAGVLRLGPSTATPVGLAAGVAGTAGLSLACGAACELAGVGRGEVIGIITRALHSAGPSGLVVAFLALSIAPGLAEELFFRGLMQGRLRLAWGRAWGVVVTAAAFGLLHLDLVQGSVAFAVGLYLGALAERFGSIRPSMLAHASNNALFLAAAHVSSPDHVFVGSRQWPWLRASRCAPAARRSCGRARGSEHRHAAHERAAEVGARAPLALDREACAEDGGGARLVADDDVAHAEHLVVGRLARRRHELGERLDRGAVGLDGRRRRRMDALGVDHEAKRLPPVRRLVRAERRRGEELAVGRERVVELTPAGLRDNPFDGRDEGLVRHGGAPYLATGRGARGEAMVSAGRSAPGGHAPRGRSPSLVRHEALRPRADEIRPARLAQRLARERLVLGVPAVEKRLHHPLLAQVARRRAPAPS